MVWCRTHLWRWDFTVFSCWVFNELVSLGKSLPYSTCRWCSSTLRTLVGQNLLYNVLLSSSHLMYTTILSLSLSEQRWPALMIEWTQSMGPSRLWQDSTLTPSSPISVTWLMPSSGTPLRAVGPMDYGPTNHPHARVSVIRTLIKLAIIVCTYNSYKVAYHDKRTFSFQFIRLYSDRLPWQS